MVKTSTNFLIYNCSEKTVSKLLEIPKNENSDYYDLVEHGGKLKLFDIQNDSQEVIVYQFKDEFYQLLKS